MNSLPCSNAVLETGADNVVGDPMSVNARAVIASTTAPGIRSVDEAIERRIAACGVPPVTPGLVKPSLDLHSIGVGEHPHSIKVALELLGESRRRLGQFATEPELLDGPRAAVGADDRQHQRVPVEPWSAIG